MDAQNLESWPPFPLAHGWAQVKDLHFCSVFLLPFLIHSLHKRHWLLFSAHGHLNVRYFENFTSTPYIAFSVDILYLKDGAQNSTIKFYWSIRCNLHMPFTREFCSHPKSLVCVLRKDILGVDIIMETLRIGWVFYTRPSTSCQY